MCKKKKKKRKEKKDETCKQVSGRCSQYKIDTEKLVETPGANIEIVVVVVVFFFLRQYLLGKPFFTPWGR